MSEIRQRYAFGHRYRGENGGNRFGVNYGGAFVEMYERKKFAINSRNIRIDEFSKRIHWNEYNDADNYENIFYVYLLPIDFIKFYKK